MSTAQDIKVAEQYSSYGQTGVIFAMDMGMVDRGASLEKFSQYPHEKEVLLPPLTSLEVLRISLLRDDHERQVIPSSPPPLHPSTPLPSCTRV